MVFRPDIPGFLGDDEEIESLRQTDKYKDFMVVAVREGIIELLLGKGFITDINEEVRQMTPQEFATVSDITDLKTMDQVKNYCIEKGLEQKFGELVRENERFFLLNHEKPLFDRLSRPPEPKEPN